MSFRRIITVSEEREVNLPQQDGNMISARRLSCLEVYRWPSFVELEAGERTAQLTVWNQGFFVFPSSNPSPPKQFHPIPLAINDPESYDRV